MRTTAAVRGAFRKAASRNFKLADISRSFAALRRLRLTRRLTRWMTCGDDTQDDTRIAFSLGPAPLRAAIGAMPAIADEHGDGETGDQHCSQAGLIDGNAGSVDQQGQSDEVP
jgi:hypothetical protein